MKKRVWMLAAVLTVCLALTGTALAGNVFAFTEKTVTLFEGETYAAALKREGSFEAEAEIVYTSGKPAVATVSEDGTITAVSKGDTTITATMRRDGKQVGRAQMTVKVLRAVQKVTLNTTKLSVYEPGDPAVADLLKEETEHQVIVVPAGTTITLNTTCTPEDASDRAVTYTGSDAGVAKISNKSLQAVQRGECDLTVASKQNPEVTEVFRVLVIQPVKKITVDAGAKKVAAGGTLQLSASYTPENASITGVTWTSVNPGIATVDENGVVTGIQKGRATIKATAVDGSNTAASVTLDVTQSVTAIEFKDPELSVVTGRNVQAAVKVLPANANDKKVKWSSTDEEIATVQNGRITGKKAGICTIVCESVSNPEVVAYANVTVSQLVTKIECANDPAELTLLTGQTLQTRWNVLPEDATNKELTYKGNHPKVFTVDENGVVTATGRGTANVVATAVDAGRKSGTVKVTVIQPVTGVTIEKPLYYVQRGQSASLRAIPEPRNANNQKVDWSSADEGIMTVRSNGTSTGAMTGITPGQTTVIATTEDGGFTAFASVRVGDFNGAVQIENVDVNTNNEIKIVLRNWSTDLTMELVNFKVECFNQNEEPMVCNIDGEKTYFEGRYPFTLYPGERTSHGMFRFDNHVINEPLGMVKVTILSWKDANGVTWWIPEYDQTTVTWTRYNNNTYQNPEQGIG